MSSKKLQGTQFRNEFLKSLNILAPRIARAIEIYGEDTVDVVNFTSSGTATLNNVSITGLTDIVSDATTEDVLDITADSLTTANVIDISADALTTGTILNLVSDSSSTSARSLVTIKNDNTAATSTTLLHLINDSQGGVPADMIIESTDAGATAAPKLRFARNSTSPAVDDVLGKILFSGKDDAGNTTLYASMRAEINDETDSGGQEDGVIVFDIIKNNSQKSVLELKNNEAVFNNAGADIDFRIESDDETHMFFIDGNENRVSIGDSTDTPAATLEVTNHASAGATGAPLVQLNSNDTDQIAVDINAANIDANVIDVTADALTTGGILNLVSDSSDTSDRTLVTVHNDNTAATGTVVMHLKNDAIGGSGDPILLIESTADETNAILELRNSNASTTGEPIIRFVRSDTSAEADDMDLGRIHFDGSDDGNNLTTFATILAEASDITGGTESGKVSLTAMNAGTERSFINYGGEDTANSTPAEVVINEGGIDVDLRVESNSQTHMLFVEAANGRVSIGSSVDTPAAVLEVVHAVNANAPLVRFDNNDTDQIALEIDAANIDADVIDITADAVTTAFVMDVTADALTTGGILNLVSDSSDTSARTLVTVKNDNTAAVGTVVMHLVNDAIGGFDDPILLIESTADETHPVLELKNSNASTTGEPIMIFTRSDTSAEADDMSLGTLIFRGVDADNNNEYYAQMKAFATDVTTGDEGGLMTFLVKAGGTAGTAGNKTLFSIGGEDVANAVVPSVVVNEDGINCDFRVEGDTETHLIFADASVDRVSIGDSTDAPAATLEVTNANDGGVPLFQLNSNDVDEEALQIVAANTTGNVLGITADSLTTGKGIVLYSNSSSGSERDLMRIRNDNTGADATTLLRLMNDADPDDTPEGATMVIEHNFNTNNRNNLALTSTGATGTTCAALALQKTTTSEADDGFLGIIRFQGMNSNNDLHEYASIVGITSDVTDGDEGGLIKLFVHAGGTAGTADFKELLNIGGEDVANGTVPAVVVNEDGINCDFRVESDGEDEAIFLDASAETLYINKGESAFTTQIHSTNDVAITVGAAGVVFNEDGHATNDFRVESDNNTHMLFVDAGDDTVAAGGIDATNHKDGFAVFNDFNGTTFENTLADGHFGSAEVLRYSPGADDTLAAGQLFFLHTDGTWDSTDADAVATGATQMLGIGLGGSARTVGCVTRGYIRIPSTEILNLPGSGACDGLPLYVSTTAGHLDFTAPSGNDDFVRIVGYAIDDDSSDVLVYFDPDKTHVEITA